jgi:hypothetical protein
MAGMARRGVNYWLIDIPIERGITTSLVRGFAQMREVSRHLHPFYVKRGICQLTDHEYDMRMPIFL